MDKDDKSNKNSNKSRFYDEEQKKVVFLRLKTYKALNKLRNKKDKIDDVLKKLIRQNEDLTIEHQCQILLKREHKKDELEKIKQQKMIEAQHKMQKVLQKKKEKEALKMKKKYRELIRKLPKRNIKL